MRAARSEPEKPVVVYAALAANLAIAVTKFAVAALTGSSAMLSEGIHSVVDTGNEVLMLVGLRRAGLPADATHPYGRGQEVFFWGLIVAIVLFAVGGGVSIYEGVHHLRRPRAIASTPWPYVVLAVAFVCEGGSLAVALRRFARVRGAQPFWAALRASKDPPLYTVIVEDSVALVGLLVAFAGIGLGQLLREPCLDAAASLVIGVVLAATAVFLAREARDLLVGESASPRVVAGIRSAVAADAAVREVREVLTMQLGPDQVLVNMGVEFRRELSGDELVAAIARLDGAVRAQYPEVTRIFIEAEPFRAFAVAAPAT